ncbi:hypothetical protein [Aurantimonas coralicida]|uniref:hypothetical protein n=1 Tax=Aurantimonas coralicida TaxID=182270 RepID=UPI001D18761B|nr:hypothetical protein [Aurantimonas coralicida]
MQNFIRGMELSIFSALVGAANATGRQRRQQPQVRVIRQTSRRSLDELIVSLKSENARANRLEAENAELRRRLAAANKAAFAAIRASI